MELNMNNSKSHFALNFLASFQKKTEIRLKREYSRLTTVDSRCTNTVNTKSRFIRTLFQSPANHFQYKIYFFLVYFVHQSFFIHRFKIHYFSPIYCH